MNWIRQTTDQILQELGVPTDNKLTLTEDAIASKLYPIVENLIQKFKSEEGVELNIGYNVEANIHEPRPGRYMVDLKLNLILPDGITPVKLGKFGVSSIEDFEDMISEPDFTSGLAMSMYSYLRNFIGFSPTEPALPKNKKKKLLRGE